MRTALRKLRAAGFRLFTLIDNLLEVQTRQLEHGGSVDLFERRVSALSYLLPHVGHPRRCRCGLEAGVINDNDVLGLGPHPQIVGADLDDVSDQFIAQQEKRTNVA